MTSNNRRPPPSNDTDLFDDLWNSITDTASEFTRSLVGLPMFYRHTDSPTLTDRTEVISVFAEPGILSPQIITFHLDRDVAGVLCPFRFVSRPVTVFDVFSQGWRNEESRFGAGMMFLFGDPLENARWLGSPGLRFTGNSVFRPWINRDEWIRKSNNPRAVEANLGFDDFEQENIKTLSNELDRRTADFQREWKNLTDDYSKSGLNAPPSFEEFEKRFHDRFRSLEGEETPQVKSYSAETSTTTQLTRNTDGSVHKETVTTERLADGSTKTTRVVISTPAGGDSQQSSTETTINTTPPVSTAVDWNRPRIEEKSQIEMNKSTGSEKSGDNDQKRWAWWFWSRK
jgi:hypothetical protein